MVSLVTLPAKQAELTDIIERKVAPLINRRKGFVDYLTLISDAEPRLVVAISIWRDRESAESFGNETAPTIYEYLKPLLQDEPQIRTFECFSIHSHKAKKATTRA